MNQRTLMDRKAGYGGPKEARNFRRRGYTMIELLVVMVIAATMSAVAVPMIWNALKSMHLSSAVQSVTGAISSTRYQALRYGYPFQLTLNTTPLTYQVSSEPTTAAGAATSFTNVGNAVSISGTSGVTLNANTTIQFNPSGTAQLITGGTGFSLDGQTFTIAYAGRTSTVTVSSVGYVTTQTQ
jgi:prepilin-type N-terminal cleavage/methylation domain-containing protein